MTKLSALKTPDAFTQTPTPQGDNSGTHLWQSPSQTQGHSAAGKVYSMKNPNDAIGNRTRDVSEAMLLTTDYQLWVKREAALLTEAYTRSDCLTNVFSALVNLRMTYQTEGEYPDTFNS